MQRVNGGATDLRAPKYGSERVVHLADTLVTVLAKHVAAHGTTGNDRWLFAGYGDGPPHHNTVSYWWRKTLRDAELSGIKLHDLRHFYASGLIASGCDVVTVQRSLGHSKATTTLNPYAHHWPTAEDRTKEGRGVDPVRIARRACRATRRERDEHRRMSPALDSRRASHGVNRKRVKAPS